MLDVCSVVNVVILIHKSYTSHPVPRFYRPVCICFIVRVSGKPRALQQSESAVKNPKELPHGKYGEHRASRWLAIACLKTYRS